MPAAHRSLLALAALVLLLSVSVRESHAAVPVNAKIKISTVATKKTAKSCWIIVSGSVYNVTSYISRHPGGSARIQAQCGEDATAIFTSSHRGKTRPAATLKGFKIGVAVKG